MSPDPTAPNRTPVEWGGEYRQRAASFAAFSAKLQAALRELIEAEGISLIQVDARGKSVDSFVEKVGRKRGKYSNPLDQITDLAGVRIVAYYTSDVVRIGQLLEREFTVDWKNSVRHGATVDPERFGYRSDHYVVTCSAARLALGEWRSYEGLKAEIQVRTALQHAWAAIDHRLNYKRASEVPNELKRQLFRISALLEVADAQFESVRQESNKVVAHYEASVKSGDLELPIDRASIATYLTETSRMQRWENAAADAGFAIDTSPDDDLDDNDYEVVGELALVCHALGFRTLNDLDTALEAAEPWGENALQALRGTGEPSWFVTPEFVLLTLVYIGSPLSSEGVRGLSNADSFYIDRIETARAAVDLTPAAERRPNE